MLLSIRPRFADAIRQGVKKVEFRRTRFARDVKWVVLCCTAPVGGIVGHFRVDQIHEATPLALWDRYQDVGGIERSEFLRYFGASRRGHAITVGALSVCREPLPPKDFLPDATAPQSFRYLSPEAFQRMQSSASIAVRKREAVQ